MTTGRVGAETYINTGAKRRFSNFTYNVLSLSNIRRAVAAGLGVNRILVVVVGICIGANKEFAVLILFVRIVVVLRAGVWEME